MSFPKTLASCLAELGMTKASLLVFERHAMQGQLSWQLSFRTLGFAKDQIDGAVRYRHPLSTDFGWQSLIRFAGRTPEPLAQRFAKERHSAGFPIALVANWRLNHTFDNRGLTPDESAMGVAKEVQERVLLFFAKFGSVEQLLEFLIKDDEPFPWFRLQGLSRLAEVARLEAALDTQSSELELLASTHKKMLEDQLNGMSIAAYTDCIWKAALSDA